MLEMILIVGLPLMTVLLARRRIGLRPLTLCLAEYVLDAAVLFLTTMLVMLPLGRIKIRWVEYDRILPQISYGKAAVVFAVVLALALGLAAPGLRRRLGIRESIEPRDKRDLLRRLAVGLGLLLLLELTLCFAWAIKRFGNISFEEMIFHLHMPLEGTERGFVRSILGQAVLPAAAIFLALAVLILWPSKRAWWLRSTRFAWLRLRLFPLKLPALVTSGVLLVWFALLFCEADRRFDILAFAKNQILQSHFIEQEYVDPKTVAITFPEKKRNLITIYLESAETSSQDRANGGFFDVNYIEEMTRLARENVSFSQSELLEGAAVAPACGWTIAGLVAESAGLPLKLFRYDDGALGADNIMARSSSFMPGVTALGDILRAEGYRNVFLCGSDFTFGGRRAYYTQHGDYEILDYLTAKEEGRIAQDYMKGWGFEDEKLYAWAMEELTELADSGQPFHFAMLTADTHPADEFVSQEEGSRHPFAEALMASSRQLDAFIQWCRQQPFYEDTVIVLTGDHSSMMNGFYGDVIFDKHAGGVSRKVYNAFINTDVEPVREKGRLFTTMDFFPTTLASLGVTIEGDRLGLGTNLFSDRQTLAEEYGYETMFVELDKKSVFYNNELLYP